MPIAIVVPAAAAGRPLHLSRRELRRLDRIRRIIDACGIVRRPDAARPGVGRGGRGVGSTKLKSRA